MSDESMTWSEMAAREGLCPASINYDEPHLVSDGRYCDECGALVDAKPRVGDTVEALVSTAFLTKGNLLEVTEVIQLHSGVMSVAVDTDGYSHYFLENELRVVPEETE